MSEIKGLLFLKESLGTYRGGIEGKILSIAKFLDENNIFKPVLLTSDPDSIFANEFKQLGLKVFSVPMHNIWRNKKTITTFIDDIVKSSDIQVIQSHAFRESLIGRLYKKKNPEVFHISRIHTHIAGSTISKFKIRLYYKIDQLTAKFADRFVVISNVLKDELITRSKIAPNKIRVVYNGIHEIGDPDNLSGKKNGVDRQIAIIGEIEERKQQLLAIRSINELKSEGIQVKLHLIGRANKNYLNDIKAYIAINKLEHLVVFHGQIEHSEIYPIIRDIPVVILPSLFEGVPTSIIEAMSLRKIVVSTDTGGTKELIKNRINGFIHRPGDLNELTNILRNIFISPEMDYDKLRENARKTYLLNFTTKAMMEGLISVYDELISN